MKSKRIILVFFSLIFLIFFYCASFFSSPISVTVNVTKKLKKINEVTLFNVDVLTDYDIIQDINKLIKETVQLFNKNNLTYWSTGGTLMGALRDKGAVPWDDDGDLCLMDYDLNKFLEMKQQFDKINIGMVIADNSKFYKLFFKNGTNTSYDFKIPFIDIFFNIKEAENVYTKDLKTNSSLKTGYFGNDYFKYKDLWPFKLYQYEDFQVNIPNNPFEYLNRAFPKWQTMGKSSNHIKNKYSNKLNKVFKLDYYNPNITKPYLWIIKHSITSTNENILKEYLSNTFEITKLNDDNILTLMPELKSITVSETLKHQLISVMFLYKYGGVFIDSSSASIPKKLYKAIENLKKYEFIGFGCDSNYDCNKPSTHIMASRPKRILMENILKQMIKISNENENENSTNLLEPILWEELVDLKKKYNYEFSHYKVTKI